MFHPREEICPGKSQYHISCASISLTEFRDMQLRGVDGFCKHSALYTSGSGANSHRPVNTSSSPSPPASSSMPRHLLSPTPSPSPSRSPFHSSQTQDLISDASQPNPIGDLSFDNQSSNERATSSSSSSSSSASSSSSSSSSNPSQQPESDSDGEAPEDGFFTVEKIIAHSGREPNRLFQVR